MSSPTRFILLLAAAAGSLTVAVVSLARMLSPGVDALPSSLVGHFGDGIELALSLTGALAALLVSVFSLVVPPVANHAVPRWAVRSFALFAGALLGITMPGGVIPTAGYTFAMTVILGVAALIALTVLRRPWLGILLAAAVIGALAYALVNLEAGRFLPLVVGTFGTVLPQASLAVAHVAAAAGLLAWVIGEAGDSRSGFARAVLLHRRVITVIAAACALPYVVARLSWLTPWPLFGGSTELFAADPTVRVVGLALGAGMLAGGVLTLGLILPWGERFPRLLAGLGGRDVPSALALVPASAVSVLFTAAGVQFALEGTGTIGETVSVLLMFPFWLWGPLLGLAAWGYAMSRAASSAQLVAFASRSRIPTPRYRAPRR